VVTPVHQTTADTCCHTPTPSLPCGIPSPRTKTHRKPLFIESPTLHTSDVTDVFVARFPTHYCCFPAPSRCAIARSALTKLKSTAQTSKPDSLTIHCNWRLLHPRTKPMCTHTLRNPIHDTALLDPLPTRPNTPKPVAPDAPNRVALALSTSHIRNSRASSRCTRVLLVLRTRPLHQPSPSKARKPTTIYLRDSPPRVLRNSRMGQLPRTKPLSTPTLCFPNPQLHSCTTHSLQLRHTTSQRTSPPYQRRDALHILQRATAASAHQATVQYNHLPRSPNPDLLRCIHSQLT
jgi:hypothetical protein